MKSEFIFIWVVIGVIIFWVVVMLPFSIVLHVYYYIVTKGKMKIKPAYTKQERNLLR